MSAAVRVTPAAVARCMGSLVRQAPAPEVELPRPAAALELRILDGRYAAWACVVGGRGVDPIALTGQIGLGERDRHAGLGSTDIAANHLVPELVAPLARASRQSGGATVRLVVTDPRLRGLLAGCRDLLGPVEVLASPRDLDASGVARTAFDLASAAMSRLATGRSLPPGADPHRVVEVATDASASPRHPEAGIAWVRGDGANLVRVVPTNDIVVAELLAIVSAVRAHRTMIGTIVVMSDSRKALALARDALHGAVSGRGSMSRSAQRDLRDLETWCRVELRWVRGHAGHRLNEVADRLAVLARRDHDAAVRGKAHVERIRRVIADELPGAAAA